MRAEVGFDGSLDSKGSPDRVAHVRDTTCAEAAVYDRRRLPCRGLPAVFCEERHAPMVEVVAAAVAVDETANIPGVDL